MEVTTNSVKFLFIRYIVTLLRIEKKSNSKTLRLLLSLQNQLLLLPIPVTF